MIKRKEYEPELKERILLLHLEEGRTQSSLTKEYGLGQGTDVVKQNCNTST